MTLVEHEAHVAGETNAERRAFFECCWHLGGAQSDVAELNAADIDWKTNVVIFHRNKTGNASIIRFGAELERVFLFPKLKPMREADRATELRRACRRLAIKGITLHSYHYACAELAKPAGYSERFAQEALGQNSKAVHRAYAHHAHVVIPALENYERCTPPGPRPLLSGVN